MENRDEVSKPFEVEKIKTLDIVLMMIFQGYYICKDTQYLCNDYIGNKYFGDGRCIMRAKLSEVRINTDL